VTNSNEKAPYDAAIEESAKAAGKALDLVKDGASHIGDIYGLLIGDQIHAARHRRLDAITRKTQKILKDRGAAAGEVSEQIAIPLLEAAQGESRSEMQDLWAQLLANAIDPTRSEDVRPEFIDALRRMQPLDAVVLEKARDIIQDPNNAVIDPTPMADALGIRLSRVEVSLQNLAQVKCLASQGHARDTRYRLVSFGIEFLLACRP
jgi:hypothetical protein